MEVSRSNSPKTPSELKDQKGGSINDENSESTAKKRRGPFKVAKRSDTEMKCPACEFTSHVTSTWIVHLYNKHRTHPYLAGVALLCECGHECLSGKHSLKCSIANFTVIRKRDGPILTFDDAKTTPKCVKCELYPKSILGYAQHLHKEHGSSLIDIRAYLLCSCGEKIHCNQTTPDHYKKCRGREFTLRNLDGSLYEFKQDKENGEEIENEGMDETEESGEKKEKEKKEHEKNVNLIFQAITEKSEGRLDPDPSKKSY